jgi:hypothetical protein
MELLLKLVFLCLVIIPKKSLQQNIETPNVQTCCPEGFSINFEKLPEFFECQNDSDKNVNKNFIFSNDGLNNILDISSPNHGFPNCHEPEELIVKINRFEADLPEFLIQKSSILINLEELSFHQDFCLDNFNNENVTIAAFCSLNLDLKCQKTSCVRKCCQFGQVIKLYIN